MIPPRCLSDNRSFDFVYGTPNELQDSVVWSNITLEHGTSLTRKVSRAYTITLGSEGNQRSELAEVTDSGDLAVRTIADTG